MRFFTSDLHFGHKNVIPYCTRPFLDVDEMDRQLITNWNNTVHERDATWILGDFSFYKPNKTLDILHQLKGEKILVKGNHDHGTTKCIGFPGYTAVFPAAEIRLDQRLPVLLSHYPYKTNEIDERFQERHMEDKGMWLLHGHVHQHWKTKNKMINVGVDVWDYKPVSEMEILKIVEPIGSGEE